MLSVTFNLINPTFNISITSQRSKVSGPTFSAGLNFTETHFRRATYQMIRKMWTWLVNSYFLSFSFSSFFYFFYFFNFVFYFFYFLYGLPLEGKAVFTSPHYFDGSVCFENNDLVYENDKCKNETVERIAKHDLLVRSQENDVL